MTSERINEQSTRQQDIPQSMSQINTPQSQPSERMRPLAFHETMEIHELLNFQTVSMVKSKLASGLVFDQDLKVLLEKNVQQSMIAVKQLESLYRAAPQLQ